MSSLKKVLSLFTMFFILFGCSENHTRKTLLSADDDGSSRLMSLTMPSGPATVDLSASVSVDAASLTPPVDSSGGFVQGECLLQWSPNYSGVWILKLALSSNQDSRVGYLEIKNNCRSFSMKVSNLKPEQTYILDAQLYYRPVSLSLSGSTGQIAPQIAYYLYKGSVEFVPSSSVATLTLRRVTPSDVAQDIKVIIEDPQTCESVKATLASLVDKVEAVDKSCVSDAECWFTEVNSNLECPPYVITSSRVYPFTELSKMVSDLNLLADKLCPPPILQCARIAIVPLCNETTKQCGYSK